MKENVVNERFLEAVNALKFRGVVKNDTDFAKKIGITQSQISNIKNVEGKNVTISIIEKTLIVFPEINSEYIFTGKGEILKNETSDSLTAKSIDNGAFGNDVEKQLRKEIADKEKLLEEIKNLLAEKEKQLSGLIRFLEKSGLGKLKVAVQQAGALFTKPAPVTQASYVMQ